VCHIKNGTLLRATFTSVWVIRMKKRLSFALATTAMVFLTLLAPRANAAAEANSLLATIKAIGREGSGNVEAARAWQELVRLRPGMLHDPSLELRRDAVELVLKNAREHLDRADKPGATAAYRKALSGARDRDQVDLIAKELKTLGVEIDLAAHFGSIRQWLL